MTELVGPLAPGQERSGYYVADMVSVPYVAYDAATGAITQHGKMPMGGIRHMETAGWNFVVGDDAHYDDFFVDLATKTVRPKTPCPAQLDGLALTGLPVPCRIEISNPILAPSRYNWTDAELDLGFDQPGTYTVRVISVPHLPGVFTVTAP